MKSGIFFILLFLTCAIHAQQVQYQSDELLRIGYTDTIVDIKLRNDSVFVLGKKLDNYFIYTVDQRGKVTVDPLKLDGPLKLSSNCQQQVFVINESEAFSISEKNKTPSIVYLNNIKICQSDSYQIESLPYLGSTYLLPLKNDTILVDFYHEESALIQNPGKTANQHRTNINNNGYPGARNYRGGQIVDVDSSGRYMIDREPAHQSSMERTRQSQYYNSSERRKVKAQPYFFMINDRVVSISEQIDKMLILDDKGNLISEKSIHIDRPVLWSNAIDEVILLKDRLFMQSTNSTGIQFYEINIESGKSELLFKLDRNSVLGHFDINEFNFVYQVLEYETQSIKMIDRFDYNLER